MSGEIDHSLQPVAHAWRSRMGRWARAQAEHVYPLLVCLVGLIAWEFASHAGYIPPYVLPSPVNVVRRFAELWQLLLKESLVTLQEILLGFGLSVLVGIFLAVALVSSRTFNRTVYSLLVASQVIPKVAIAPIFIVWFGFGLTPKVLIAFLVAFFPVTIDTVVGLRSVATEKLYVARAAGANAWQLFWLVRLPSALPSIFGGMKVSITLAVAGAIVGEFVAAESGIGRLLLSANGNMDIPLLFAGVLALSIMGFLLFLVVEGFERMMLPWHVSQRVGRGTNATT
jgi:NitT/TauT family transport system permease protein